MAPADNAGTPSESSTDENVCAATVAPAVVEAVAPAIRIPAMGARRNAGMLKKFRADTTSACSEDALIIPAIVPVPRRRMETPVTLERPNSANFENFFQFPVMTALTRPPAGSAIIGSIVTPKDRSASRIITTSGPEIAFPKEGSSFASPFSSSSSVTGRPFLPASRLERMTVMINAQIAGMTLDIAQHK